MSETYEEILEGVALLRPPPGARHELICDRLHAAVQSALSSLPATFVLPLRAKVQITSDTTLCPDLSLVTARGGKLWLAAEVISSGDHQTDTVVKKEIYEELKLPRLWMIDPRYDTVEIYHGTAYGLALKESLAGRDVLVEKLIPGFQIPVAELFAAKAS